MKHLDYEKFREALRRGLKAFDSTHLNFFEGDEGFERGLKDEDSHYFVAYKNGAELEDIIEAIHEGYAYEKYVLKWTTEDLLKRMERRNLPSGTGPNNE